MQKENLSHISLDTKQKRFAPIAEKIIVPIIHTWIKDIHGLENVPKNKNFILAPNHASYIEHPLLAATLVPYLNKKIHFLAKKEHFTGKGQYLWHMLWNKYIGYIPVDRSDANDALITAREILAKGEVLVTYPEGTRSLDGKLQKGKTGIARLLLKTKLPVIPVGLNGTFEILPKGKNIPRLRKATISFGKALEFSEYYNSDVSYLQLREITDKIMKEISVLISK
ncbi:MAG: 1-acyl-sn-glycerol-3-phosphate acyltransferase [Oligoflexia bacterium]|nr:1-acyl-sn-glycerol-3-phosphate acyltransferase [Oligoflexia bacterium]